MMGVLDGVLMELQDCALPLLKGTSESGRERDFFSILCLSKTRFQIFVNLSIRNYFINVVWFCF